MWARLWGDLKMTGCWQQPDTDPTHYAMNHYQVSMYSHSENIYVVVQCSSFSSWTYHSSWACLVTVMKSYRGRRFSLIRKHWERLRDLPLTKQSWLLCSAGTRTCSSCVYFTITGCFPVDSDCRLRSVIPVTFTYKSYKSSHPHSATT